MKTIVTIFPTDLVANLLFSYFCPFLQTKNKNQVFSQVRGLVTRIFLLFVYSESCSISKSCRVQYTFIKEFSNMSFLFVL